MEALVLLLSEVNSNAGGF